MPEVEPAYSAGVLLLIAALSVGVLLFLIMKVRCTRSWPWCW